MNNGADCPRCLGWTFDEEPCQSQMCRGIAEGIAAERARIVAWLFHRAAMRDPSHPKESLVASTLYEALAKQIQAGVHEEDHCGNATERGEHEDK